MRDLIISLCGGVAGISLTGWFQPPEKEQNLEEKNMKLRELLDGIEYSGKVDLDSEIAIVLTDSRKVVDGSVFVCIKGKRFDGHAAAGDALSSGAVAVVTERELGLDNEIVVADTRAANAKLCQNFFRNPQDSLKLIALTGTNGKTTVSNIIKQALTVLGYKTGLIGTIRCEICDMEIPSKFTTPEPWDLCALFSRMLAAGCTHVVMEASSQALDQGRLIGLNFICSVFTNLTQDHLDYHGTMENYYQAKRSLFDNTKTAVINIDDESGRRLLKDIAIPAITVSASDDTADYVAKDIDYAISGVKFNIGGEGFEDRISFPMPGLYSVNNAICAAAALFALDIDKHISCDAVSEAKGVKGRCEVLFSEEFTVMRDYAHTGDGLEQLLSSLKPFVKGRLIVLFGCGGRRDPKKRPKMANAVAKFADFIILSSDNPRTEDPMAIIDQVSGYLRDAGVTFTSIPDRTYAIKWGIENMKKDDVLVLCGKGHEDYQIIDGCTIYLDESRVVEDVIAEYKSKRS